MIGRDKERSEVIDTLLHKFPARIAILGGGGMGKTTLALSVLHEPLVVDQYPSRYFVSCEGAQSVSSLVGEIANALRIPLANRDAHLIDTILSSFPADTLLCLDNLETIWDIEPMRSDLEGLLSDPELRVQGIIITMRHTASIESILVKALPPTFAILDRRQFETYI
jgi:GTPase SAR1 family protein